MSDVSGGPKLPTYRTVADFLEKKNGSGLRLLGWTIARTALIAPPFILIGIPPKKAFLGAVLASCLISSLTLLRIWGFGPDQRVLGAVRKMRRGRSLSATDLRSPHRLAPMAPRRSRSMR